MTCIIVFAEKSKYMLFFNTFTGCNVVDTPATPLLSFQEAQSLSTCSRRWRHVGLAEVCGHDV